MIRMTLFGVIAVGDMILTVGEISGSTLNSARTDGDLQPTSRMRGVTGSGNY